MEHKYKLDHKAIAARVKNARKQAKLTQAELAEKIGVSTNAVAKLETNLMTASLQTIINIVNVLNIDINYLLLDNVESKRQANTDIVLNNLLANLSKEDKDFLIHVISGLNIYHMGTE